jgi:hopanoid biosynthesis associated protein HpnK
MKRLIVNADDFGFTPGVNAGVVHAWREGIVTGTTLMASGDAFHDAVELARVNPELPVGCHLVLVGGQAVAKPKDVPSLADSDGRLPRTILGLMARLATGKISIHEIENEFRAQIERLRHEGIQPTHLDTHKHTHVYPRVMEALVQVAGEFGITRVRKPFEDLRRLLGFSPGLENGRAPLKQRAAALAVQPASPRFQALVKSGGIRTPDHLYGMAMTGRLAAEAILRVLGGLPEGSSELICHPGAYDADLERAPTRLKKQRQAELEALTDPAVRRAAEMNGIQLISYRELN